MMLLVSDLLSLCKYKQCTCDYWSVHFSEYNELLNVFANCYLLLGVLCQGTDSNGQQ